MSKITKALDKAKRERDQKSSFLANSAVNHPMPISSVREGNTSGSSLIWILGIIIFIVILVVFNLNKGKDAVPLTEIFPEEEVYPIDVEYEFVKDDGAIKKLVETEAMKAQGVAMQDTTVKKEELPKIAENKAPSIEINTTESIKIDLSDSSTASFTIQVASFKDKAKAEIKLKELQDKGYSSFIASRNLGEKGIWHRIYVGQFNTHNEANVYLTKIKQDYPSSFIIIPKK